jgi:hypothetical protein
MILSTAVVDQVRLGPGERRARQRLAVAVTTACRINFDVLDDGPSLDLALRDADLADDGSLEDQRDGADAGYCPRWISVRKDMARTKSRAR